MKHPRELRFVLLFGAMGASCVGLAALLGGCAWLLVWPGLVGFVLALGYGGFGPRIFAKRPDGTLSPLRVLLLAPYFLVTWTLWGLLRLTGEPSFHEVRPGLYLGRRPLERELPRDVRAVVDLTAEFAADRRPGVAYLCAPALDGGVPEEQAMRELLRALRKLEGPVYVHCAAGHARSASVVAAMLVLEGRAATIDDAERMLQDIRPRVSMTASQRALVARLVRELAAEPVTR
jgi:protein-tyrosine phosphatase